MLLTSKILPMVAMTFTTTDSLQLCLVNNDWLSISILSHTLCLGYCITLLWCCRLSAQRDSSIWKQHTGIPSCGSKVNWQFDFLKATVTYSFCSLRFSLCLQTALGEGYMRIYMVIQWVVCTHMCCEIERRSLKKGNGKAAQGARCCPTWWVKSKEPTFSNIAPEM